MDKESTILELSRSLVSPRTLEDLSITMEATLTMEEVLIITMAPRMDMGREQAVIRTALTQPQPPRRIKVTLLVTSVVRLDITPTTVRS